MKLRDFLAAVEGMDPDAEFLIWREIYEDGPYTNFKVKDIMLAFAPKFELERISWDISSFINDGEGARPIVVLSDGKIPRYIRTSYQFSGATE